MQEVRQDPFCGHGPRGFKGRPVTGHNGEEGYGQGGGSAAPLPHPIPPPLFPGCRTGTGTRHPGRLQDTGLLPLPFIIHVHPPWENCRRERTRGQSGAVTHRSSEGQRLQVKAFGVLTLDVNLTSG